MRLLSSGQIRCGIKCKRRDAAFISLIGVVVLVLNIAFVHFCFVSARNGDSALTLIDETNEEILWSSYQRKASIVVDIEETPIAASAARVRKVEESADWRPTKRKDESNFSACMIIKDDNDLLNEWLSYHYHALDMRYLLVAVDPTSATSPAPIFERWRRLTDLQIIEWSDRNFMPESFLQKGYSIHPDELNGDAKISKWHQGHEDPEKVKSDNLQIANHRFRQITFLSACLRHMRFNKKTWVMHVDTDEFVVVNPLLRNTTQANVRMVKVGLIKDKSSVFDVIKQYQRDPKLRRKFNYPCISMPRLLFGSEEVTYNISMPHFAAKPPAFLNATNFETLRWKYHTFFNDVERNAQPKVIVDVSAVSSKDEMFSKPFSIHRPSKSICRRIDQLHFHQLQRYPITVNHYTGSWERYYLAKNDTRRSEKAYNFKAHVADGYDDWMPPWLDGFVLAIGENAAKELLHQYTTDKDKRKLPHANKGTSQQQSLPHDEVTASI